jgi:hypothetical protein
VTTSPRVASGDPSTDPAGPAAALGAAAWLEHNILRSAADLAAAGRARAGLTEAVGETLRKIPIQPWEADRWLRGIKLRLIRMEEFFFRAGVQKRSALSLFVRNEKGLNVGLRREAITQMATYVSLVTDYGYERRRTRFESRFMDVLVLDRQQRPWIYAENKAAERTLDRLCERLALEFSDGVPRINEEDEARVDDAVMKASHLWKHRPPYFWAVSPTRSGDDAGPFGRLFPAPFAGLHAHRQGRAPRLGRRPVEPVKTNRFAALIPVRPARVQFHVEPRFGGDANRVVTGKYDFTLGREIDDRFGGRFGGFAVGGRGFGGLFNSILLGAKE